MQHGGPAGGERRESDPRSQVLAVGQRLVEGKSVCREWFEERRGTARQRDGGANEGADVAQLAGIPRGGRSPDQLQGLGKLLALGGHRPGL